MERLRRRIEHFRQHHNSCESRYESATLERLEQERQQTISLHQRCLQAKAKKSSKHRAPQANNDSPGQRPPNNVGSSADAAEGGGSELNRNSTLIALQETVKRKLVSASSPLDREQTNGYPPNKKTCLDPGGTNGSIDSKMGVAQMLTANGSRGPAGDPAVGNGELDVQHKEMKQEPDDILPIMPPVGGATNSLFPDLNLDEQEWTELMEELSRSVAYEDIQDIFNEGFEDRKDPSDLITTQETAVGESLVGGPHSSHGLPQLDLGLVKSEFSPSSAAFEPDSKSRSQNLCNKSAGPPSHSTSSPVTSSSGSSPALPPPQPAQSSRQHHLLPPAVSKDLSPAQQLQQLAAQQQRVQNLHSQLQHKPSLPGSKFHPHGPRAPPPPPPWPQVPNATQSQRGAAYGLDKPTSPSLYSQDYNPKQMLLPTPPAKCPPKAPVGSFLPRPGVMGAPHAAGGHPGSLNYNNTKPLSHFEAAPAPVRPPMTQNKAALLNLLRQQQQMKQKNLNYRPLQDQNSYTESPRGPVPPSTLTSTPSNNMPVQPGAMAANHGNTVYINNQAEVTVALKQQQQQQQQQYMQQRQQMMAEQEKQRQQDQQLQRHLTRPPPQYQDQLGPPANHGSFSQPPVNQFTASSQPMASVGTMGGSASGPQRMFPQNQSMMGLNPNQTDMSLSSCGSGVDVQQVLYNNMNLHQQRQVLPPMNAPYRQNLMSQQQQHPKSQPHAAMMKQQQQQQLPTTARLPMQGAPSWQQPPNSTTAPPPFSPNTFHLQPRLPKMPAGAPPFSGGPGGRQVDVINPGQQIVQTTMNAGQQRALPNSLSLNNQQQTPQSNRPGPDITPFAQTAGGVRPGPPCNQGYQVTRATNQQQLSFGYNVASGSFAAESDLVDSLLKGQSTQEWIAELDELLAGHH